MKDLSLLGSMMRRDHSPAGKSFPRQDPAALASQLAASSAMSRRRIRFIAVVRFVEDGCPYPKYLMALRRRLGVLPSVLVNAADGWPVAE